MVNHNHCMQNLGNNRPVAKIVGESSYLKVIFSTKEIDYELINNQQVKAILDDFNSLSDKNGPQLWIMIILMFLVGACFVAFAIFGYLNVQSYGNFFPFIIGAMISAVAFAISATSYHSYKLRCLERILSDRCFELNGIFHQWNFTYSKEVVGTHLRVNNHVSSSNIYQYEIIIKTNNNAAL